MNVLASNIVNREYTVYGTSIGITYKFAVKARNAFGYSV